MTRTWSRVWGLGSRVEVHGFRVQRSEISVQGLGCQVYGVSTDLPFTVWGFGWDRTPCHPAGSPRPESTPASCRPRDCSLPSSGARLSLVAPPLRPGSPALRLGTLGLGAAEPAQCESNSCLTAPWGSGTRVAFLGPVYVRVLRPYVRHIPAPPTSTWNISRRAGFMSWVGVSSVQGSGIMD